MVGIVGLWEEGGRTLIPVGLQETVTTRHWTRNIERFATYIIDFTVDASFLLVLLFLLVFLLLLVFLRDDVVQVAEVMLGEHVVHGPADGDQRQDLQTESVVASALAYRSWSLQCSVAPATSHHDGEDDGSHSGLEDPEEGQTQALDEGEEVDASLGDVPQVDQVRLVLGRHQKELQAIHELTQTNRADQTGDAAVNSWTRFACTTVVFACKEQMQTFPSTRWQSDCQLLQQTDKRLLTSAR